MQNHKKSGFTLIELSIVLVIIGLIVGGVLVGQDLIEAAKLRAVTSDYEKYNTAVMTFELEYDCLAGDCPNATTFGLGTNGDGDKMVDYLYANDTPLETYGFWQHLGNAGLVKGTYTGSAGTGYAGLYAHNPGVNVPKGAIDDSSVSYFFPRSAQFTGVTITVDSHIMALGSISGVYVDLWDNPALTPLQQMNIDQKIDDGKPYTGNVSDMIGAPYSPNCTTSEVVATAEYDLSKRTKECVLIWKAPF